MNSEGDVDETATSRKVDDEPDKTPWPIDATVRPEGAFTVRPEWRWGAADLWLKAAALVVGVVIAYRLFSIEERLRELVVAVEAK